MTPDTTEHYWTNRIERDLTPFADPGTKVEIEESGRHFSASWKMKGRDTEATFTVLHDFSVQVLFNHQTMTFQSFLASTELADLLGIAKMMIQTSSRQSPFVPTKARLKNDNLLSTASSEAINLLNEILGEESIDVTRIIMITGEAGAGKTSVLRELVIRQADLYERGQSNRLYFYINAQGRALARFNEALATELQDLRAALTYHAVSTLVRAGIFIPIIDGFDELLGVGGYDDAFNSLSAFIEELDGHGQILASARSTYYEQEFVQRANRVSALGAQSFTQIPIEIQPWRESESSSYLESLADRLNLGVYEKEQLKHRVHVAFSGANGKLMEKPLFVAKTIELLYSDHTFDASDDLFQDLIQAYLERERREKLLDRNGNPMLTNTQLELIFVTLAEEMWNQETRELSERSIREIAELLLAVENFPEASREILAERMPQLAFLMVGERTGTVTFEHEMFFSYFLSRTLTEQLNSATRVRSFLSRSALPLEVATDSVHASLKSDLLNTSENIQIVFSKLGESSQWDSPRSNRVKENAGIVASALLKGIGSAKLLGLQISRITIPGGDLADVTLENCSFNDVEIRRVDLTRTKFINCSCKKILFSEVIIDPSFTRLEIEGLDVANDVFGLREGPGLSRGIYRPHDIRVALESCGATVSAPAAVANGETRNIPDNYIELLARLAAEYRRTNPICTSDQRLRSLFLDNDWHTIERLLVQHGIVTSETRPSRGNSKTFLRRKFLFDEVMAGIDRSADVSPQISNFWNQLSC